MNSLLINVKKKITLVNWNFIVKTIILYVVGCVPLNFIEERYGQHFDCSVTPIKKLKIKKEIN